MATAFWRIALALLPLLILTHGAGGHATDAGYARTWRDRGLAALPGLFLGAELSAWHASLQMTSVANATLLVNMTPIPVALMGWLLFRNPIRRRLVIGLALAVVGFVCLKGGPMALGRGRLSGDVVAMVGACLYACYFLSLYRARERFGTFTVMWWSTLSAALAVLPFVIWLEPNWLPTTLAGWAVVMTLAWVCHAGGQGLITFALAWLPPSFSSLTLLIQPIVAALLAWWLLGERLGGLQIFGGVVVLVGILVARRS